MTGVRCSNCHRYLEYAPDPSLEHGGSPGDARCVLDHHPEPCDFVNKKGKKCAEYGDPNDPDYDPGKDLGTRKKTDAGANGLPDKTAAALGDLNAKNAVLEANFGQMKGSVDKLADDMSKLMKMMATMAKTDPKPLASLSDNTTPQGAGAALGSVPATGVLGTQPATSPGLLPSPTVPSLVPTTNQITITTSAPLSSILSSRVDNLISSNSTTLQSSPSLGG